MTQPTNTFDTYDSKGNREALSDIITNISPTDTPFFSMCAKGKATATYEEWTTDALAAAAANAVIEGDEATLDASVASVRVGNYTQISDKTVVVTGTQEVINKAGRKSEKSYQIAKKGKELKRDMEVDLTGNVAQVAGNATTARKSGGLGSWIATNDVLGSAGSPASPTGDGTDARTDGTQRVLVESLVKSVMQSCWTEGGEPTCLMVGPHNKTVISGFTGNSTRFDAAEDKKLIAAIDVYESDFGSLEVIPNRFSRDRDAWVLDKSMWEVKTLRPFQTHELSKTGDSEKLQLLVEYTLCSKQEKASGLVADLTVS